MVWLLNHLATALTAQQTLDRKKEGILLGPAEGPTAVELLAAQLAEPLAHAHSFGRLAAYALAVYIEHYDAILEGQVTFSNAPEEQQQQQHSSCGDEYAAAPQPFRSHDGEEALPPPSGPPPPFPPLQQRQQPPLPPPPGPPPQQQQQQRPSLHEALEEADAAAAVSRALDQRGDVNEKNEQGFTVLMVASSLGLASVVELLLGAGETFLLFLPTALTPLAK